MNRQFSVSDRPPFAAFRRQSTQFFLLCVNCLFNFRCPQTLFCVYFLPPSSLDRYFVTSACRLPLFQLPLRPDTSSPSVCRTHVFNFASSFFRQRQRQTFLSYRLIALCLRLLCVDCAFSTSAAHSFSLSISNWDIAISVKFLVLRRSSVFRRFFVPAPISHCSSEAESYCSVELGNRTVIERDNRVCYFRFSFSCSSEAESYFGHQAW